MAAPFPNVLKLQVKQVRLDNGKSFAVYYLASYWPKRYGELAKEVDSVRILELKNGDLEAARHFAAKLSVALDGAPKKCVVAMPSHGVGSASSRSGLRLMLGCVSGVIDLSDCLVRHTAVTKSSRALPADRPTPMAHRESMQVIDAQKLNGTDLLLLDDVVTQGASMRGAKYHLVQAGARSVTCLSLTKTM